MSFLARRKFLIGAGVAAVGSASAAGYFFLRPNPAPIGFDVSTLELEQAHAFLAAHVSIDAHAHPGRTFLRGAQNVSGKLFLGALLGSSEDAAVQDMRAGGLTAAAFAAVSDVQTLGEQGEGLAAVREFEPGEAWASYKRQIANLNALSANGLVYPVRTARDFEAARTAGRPGAFLTVEGGDCLEGKPERVTELFADGVRSITLVHYRNNEIGDIITGKPVHGGLSAAGVAIVRAMNEAGILVDVAHASEATAFATIKASTKPVIASHVHISTKALEHPRFISGDLAKAIVETGGGIIGAWPAGIGITDMAGYVTRTLALIDAVGIDHVCMGTDMDANYKPAFDTYANLPYYVAGLRQRGLSDGDLAKVIGDNFLRIFKTVGSA